MSESSADRHAMARYWVLRVLAKQYPNPLDIHVLRRAVADLGFPLGLQDLSVYVAYLAEKGFARTEEREEFDLKMITCTADGLDAVDGRIAAPGLSRG